MSYTGNYQQAQNYQQQQQPYHQGSQYQQQQQPYNQSQYYNQYQHGSQYGSQYGGQYGNQYGSQYQGGNYYQQQQPGQMPPNANPQHWQWFSTVDRDGSGELDVDELRQALINDNNSRFEPDTVQLLISMHDKRNRGTVNFQEFTNLLMYIQEWRKCFNAFDADRSHNIDRGELKNALFSFGYKNVSDNVLSLLERKYAKSGQFNFDRFITISVIISNLTNTFEGINRSQKQNGIIELNYEKFLEIVISNKI